MMPSGTTSVSRCQHQAFSTLALIILGLCCVGCAEGPFWRTGKLSPWAQNKWAAEELVADTYASRKRKMTESVEAVINAPVEDQQRVALDLAEVLHRDQILMLRLYSVRMLGKLNCPAAVEALVDASQDHTSDIRIESIKAIENLTADIAIPHLQKMIGSDTDIDVRLAATRALGSFSGRKAIAAISLALDDRDPALQLRAAESLQNVTGEQLGPDIAAWQQFVKNTVPDMQTTQPDPAPPTAMAPTNGFNSVANEAIDSIFK
ncbi:MAG: hypothetical protein ACI87E_000223 [Mariniblastus sp.]|jgi:hypothetical protein